LLLTALFVAVRAEARSLKVFILAGQSNMEGQGVVSMDGERDYNGDALGEGMRTLLKKTTPGKESR
jgi:hypothetical protein